MSDEVYYETTSYCASCDEYFYDHGERRKHFQVTESHPRCDLCHKRFLNKNTLRVHYLETAGHHYCVTCDKLFDSAGGLQVHIDYAAVHRDDSDDEDEDEDDYKEREDNWEDELALEVYPDGYRDPTIYYPDDTSFEDFDDYDFEDEEELGDPPFDFGEELEDEQLEEGVEETDEFQCPMCQKCSPSTVCSTSCGHLFCAPCIKAALHYTGMCPVCDERDDVAELRRVFLTSA
ncbi:hypothetical protein E1B28_002986 [Marasmius oreades]|uniref:RING-type domain-containing protein n=1 Tax=Marasmius oreades TaxID=181124 RepID=A0A9P7RKS1_9AGAR|nr:uncharacterized protein E1B28_002986 [Marasmius oreades]KAG7085425.1 hypothetical protein E1B28_002986 [Marasmius oreades]